MDPRSQDPGPAAAGLATSTYSLLLVSDVIPRRRCYQHVHWQRPQRPPGGTTTSAIGRVLYSAIIQPHFQQLYEAEVEEGKSGWAARRAKQRWLQQSRRARNPR